MKTTPGYSSLSIGSSRYAEGKAIRSGTLAAMVFGATSAKIRKITVMTMGASTTPVSPNKRRPITVAMLAAVKFTRLLPIRITPSNRSGRLSSRFAFRAPRCFCFTRCRSRYRLSAIIAVSELEK